MTIVKHNYNILIDTFRTDLKENYNITKQIEITKKPAKKKIYFAGDKNIKNIIR